jgi:hypothetical protein
MMHEHEKSLSDAVEIVAMKPANKAAPTAAESIDLIEIHRSSGLADRANPDLPHRRIEFYTALTRRWCTCRTEHAMTLTPICYAMTRVRRTESGRPAASIWFRTATPMAASVRCAAKPRARNRDPISVL